MGALLRYVAGHFERPWSCGDLLDRVGLADHAGERVARLSGGQRRRLDLALGLVGQPELLFLDEPTTGFDPQARRDVWQLLEDVRDAGATILNTVSAINYFIWNTPPGDLDRAHTVSRIMAMPAPNDLY